MGKKGIVIVFIIFLAAAIAAGAYYLIIQRPQSVISDKQIEEFITDVNTNVHGLTIMLDPHNVGIHNEMKSLFDKPQYLITVNKARFIFDSTFFESPAPNVQLFKIPVATEQIVMRYRPVDKYLSLRTIEAINIDMKEMIQSTLEKNSKPFTGSAFFHIGRVNLGDFNLSPFIKNEKGDRHSQVLGADILALNSKYDITTKDISFIINEKTQESLQLTIKTIKTEQNFNSDFIKAVFENTKEKVDFASFAQSPDPILEYSMDIEDIKMSQIKKTGQKSGATIASFGFTYSLEPSDYKDMFTGHVEHFLKELHTQMPQGASHQPVWAKSLTDLKKLNLKFTLDRISPSMLKIYRDIVQEQIMTNSHESEEEIKQQLTAYGFRFMGVLMQSQPILSFNLSPFELSYAKLEANGSFQFGQGYFPTGKASATIFNFANLKETLVNKNLMSADEAEGFVFLLNNYFTMDPSGNGVLTFEVLPQPPHVLLNGQPLS